MTYDPTDVNDPKVNALLDAHREGLIARLKDSLGRGQSALLDEIDQRIIVATLQSVHLDAELVERQYQRNLTVGIKLPAKGDS